MSLIPEHIIQQVIDRCDIVEIVSEYLPLKKAGRNFKATSPFKNEKTPSFVVSPDKQIFHCFSTGIGGNVISFVMRMERMEFPEAVRFLAEKVGIDIPKDEQSSSKINIRQQLIDINEHAVNYFHNVLLSDKSKSAVDAREYLKNRGVDLEATKQFKLGLALDKWDGLLNHLKSLNVSLSLMEKAGLIIAREKKDGYYDRFRNRIIFPILNTRAHCIAFGARALANDDGAKYINSPETPLYTKGHHLYGFHLSRQSIGIKDEIIIVEGYMDCLMPYQAGVDNIVASLGTALTVDQIRLLRRYTKNVVMLFDMDAAGQAAMIRNLDTLIEEGMSVKVASLDEGQDPDSFIRQYGVESFNNRIQQAKTLFDFKLNFLMNLYDSQTIEGKAKIASEMLPSIKKFENAVLQSGYTKQLAEKLGIPERALMQELGKVQNITQREYFHQEEKHGRRVSAQRRLVERHMLKFLLNEGDFIAQTKDVVMLTDFQDEQIRNVISKLYELFEKGENINVGKLMNSFEDQATQEMLSELMAEDQIAVKDKEKMHRDFVNRLKQDTLKLKRQELLVEIQEAEHSGNLEKLDQLKEIFNQLIKG